MSIIPATPLRVTLPFWDTGTGITDTTPEISKSFSKRIDATQHIVRHS